MTDGHRALFQPLELPCGAVLKNRIAKSAMSDSLADGTGHPTAAQIDLYRQWAEGGAALTIIGEVQGNPAFAEKPGNLVLDEKADPAPFKALAAAGSAHDTQIWMQLGHAGAMAYPPTSTPKGPSALDLPGLRCEALTPAEIRALPAAFARTARLARDLGFGGVQVHAAHGFLLSQFLSPLFNTRGDGYGSTIAGRMRLLLEVIQAVRAAVGPAYPIGVKLNSTDQLEGGLNEADALSVVAALEETGVDLIDISGGTYFPGARSASDNAGKGPYFLSFATRARRVTTKPLMLTGGFKTLKQCADAIAEGACDVVGLARALALEPSLPTLWQSGRLSEPAFPRFTDPPEGGVTAWYTMRLTEIGEGREGLTATDIDRAIQEYEARDQERTTTWLQHFPKPV